MQPPIPIASPWWLKVSLLLSTFLFAAVAAGLLTNAFLLQPTFGWSDKVWNFLLAVALSWLAFLGLRLVRFMNHTLVASDDGVRISSSSSTRHFSWGELRIRDRRRVHTIEVRTTEGELVFAADWYAKNARRLPEFALSGHGTKNAA